MASKKTSSRQDLHRHSIAPPATASDLDIKNLDSQFKNMGTEPKTTTSRNKIPKSHKPSTVPESSKQSVRIVDSKPPTKVPESHRPSKVAESSKQSIKNVDSVKPSQKVLPSIKEKSSVPTTKPSGKLDNSRVQTEHYKVGNMDRTYLEGMVPKSQYNEQSQKTYPATEKVVPSIVPSIVPNTTRSILTKPEDISMAARQSQYQSLKPAEQKKQEHWAQSQLARTGMCPEGFDWNRIGDGYQCQGGHHFVTDLLLGEGHGGVYVLLEARRPDVRLGPYYARDKEPGVFYYAGPQPKPIVAPSVLAGSGNTQVNRGLAVSHIHGSRYGI